jgi:Fe-S-cluster containining protein
VTARRARDPDEERDAADARLVAAVDEEMRRAIERAGPAFACHAGRTECCHGPFPVNLLDARRLRLGLAALARDDPDRAAGLRARAEESASRLSREPAVDPWSGLLRGGEAAEEALCDGHEGDPCPVLDPATGRCDLYAFRPLACRTMGPPVRLGAVDLAACPHCFAAARVPDLEGCRAKPDPDGSEDALVDALERRLGVAGETLVALAVAGRVRGLP